MAPARKGKAKEEQPVVTLGPQAKEGELVFGVAHIYASFNDTFVHVTDISDHVGNADFIIEMDNTCFLHCKTSITYMP
ncbi:hypothetical protein ANCDUO_09049 [Ancylostoma duodenale]|uniref:Ribosomal protein S11 n=1 Tax=Ancylostoma duodenale TaxID=51022 RepID=A0A0C2GHM0_9BILA|nr:hypothetical protein ANCDUO_09049 [Ancylostoma duodenale]